MNRSQPTAVFFCTPEVGHFQALCPMIGRIAAAGMSAWVFTHRDFQVRVEQCGGKFVDLFGKYSIDEADDESKPIPCRFVSFAGAYAERVIEEVRQLNPAVIIYETFSVIGPIVARALGIPHVNVCPNHNANPARCLEELRNDKRVMISAKCRRAVETLHERFGVRDASPFSYVTSLSPMLNVYCEPRQFLGTVDREAFEPVSFFGSLPDNSSTPAHSSNDCSYFDRRPSATLRVYVSFGTVIWRYFADDAIATLRTISSTLEKCDQVSAVISLYGAANASDLAPALNNRNVRAVSYVNQLEILEEADLFVTHHGLNSTHEAISRRVAMISYPFFWDQPALARKCQELGLAIPLTDSLRGTVTTGHVEAALVLFAKNRPVFTANLTNACAWEEEAIAERDLVIDRIWELTQPGSVRESLRSE